MSDEERTSEVVPAAEAVEPTPKAVDPSLDPMDMPLEELLARTENSMFEEDIESQQASAPEEQPAEEPAAPAEDEEAPSELATEPGEPTQEPSTEEPATKPAVEESAPSEVDELRAMLDVQQSEAKHFESLLGRHTGSEDFHKRKIASMETELADLRTKLTNGDTYPVESQPQYTAQQPSVPQPQQATDSVRTYLVGQAIEKAAKDFLEVTEGLSSKDENGQLVADPNFVTALQRHQEAITAVQQTDDPLFAGQEIRRVLSSAWGEADRERKVVRLKEIQRKRADQTKRLDQAKVEAASASTSPTAPQARRKIDPWDPNIPTEELRKRAEKESPSF